MTTAHPDKPSPRHMTRHPLACSVSAKAVSTVHEACDPDSRVQVTVKMVILAITLLNQLPNRRRVKLYHPLKGLDRLLPFDPCVWEIPKGYQGECGMGSVSPLMRPFVRSKPHIVVIVISLGVMLPPHSCRLRATHRRGPYLRGWHLSKADLQPWTGYALPHLFRLHGKFVRVG